MKNTTTNRFSSKLSLGLLSISSAIIICGSVLATATGKVGADSYQDRIDALSAQNSKSQTAIAGLQNQAASYQAIIDGLQSQIATLELSIRNNQAQQASLQQQITDDQHQIDQEKAYLASDIKSMYVDGTPSTLEVLATSKNLSEFVDKQEYRTTVQNKLQDTLKKIAALQKELTTKKAQVDQLLSQETTQQTQLADDQAQQRALLNANESQQASYVSQLQSNNAQIAAIQRERAAAIAKISGTGGKSAVGSSIKYKNFWTAYSTCGGGYSYCWAGYDQGVSDPWGLGYAHECVHFVADWLARHGYRVPHFAGGGGGNADHWAGYGTVVSSPRVGDVAYMPLAPVGHVGVVTAINGDGTYHIEQMNWPVGGYYSEMDLYPQNITFIRFPS